MGIDETDSYRMSDLAGKSTSSSMIILFMIGLFLFLAIVLVIPVDDPNSVTFINVATTTMQDSKSDLHVQIVATFMNVTEFGSSTGVTRTIRSRLEQDR